MSETNPTKASWHAMWARCSSPTHVHFKNYGGRGITVCERWRQFESFLEDMGPRSAGTSLDRIDNDGNYGPGNCRWATPREQALNRRDNWRIQHSGRVLAVTQWADESGLGVSTIRERLRRGWTPGKAVAAPAMERTQIVEFRGEALPISEWARRLGLARRTLCNRLASLGWSVERALTTPAGRNGGSRRFADGRA